MHALVQVSFLAASLPLCCGVCGHPAPARSTHVGGDILAMKGPRSACVQALAWPCPGPAR